MNRFRGKISGEGSLAAAGEDDLSSAYNRNSMLSKHLNFNYGKKDQRNNQRYLNM